VALFLIVSLLSALNSAAAQGRGNGKGGGGDTGWVEQFNDSIDGIIARGWRIEHTATPESQFGVPGVGLASKTFDSANVTVLPAEGVLRLKLSIAADSAGGLHSSGGLVYTAGKYGYGTYEWCARMSSTATTPGGSGVPVPGGVSANFTYVNDSETEIDFEFAHASDSSGRFGPWLYMVNWRNLTPTHTALWNLDPPGPYHTGFMTYRFVWTRNYIDYYVNGNLLRTHVQNIPRSSAHIMANHWGTNSSSFGGPASVGDRYFYLDWFRYTPPRDTPTALHCGS
jgi:beta-glucanase (GH16 family)